MVLYLKQDSLLLNDIQEFLEMTIPVEKIIFEVDVIFAAKVFNNFASHSVILSQLEKFGDSIKGRLFLKPELADYLNQEGLLDDIRDICKTHSTSPFTWNTIQKSNVTRFPASFFCVEQDGKKDKLLNNRRSSKNGKEDNIEDKLVKILSMYPSKQRLPDIKELNEYHLEEYLNLTNVKMDDIRLALLNYHLMIERIEELLKIDLNPGLKYNPIKTILAEDFKTTGKKYGFVYPHKAKNPIPEDDTLPVPEYDEEEGFYLNEEDE